jgi:GGDEF domain-containing protein
LDDRFFGVVLPGADEKIARTVAARLRTAVASSRLSYVDGQLPVSIAVEAVQVRGGDSAEELLAHALQALQRDPEQACSVDLPAEIPSS